MIPPPQRTIFRQTWQGRPIVVVDEGPYRSLYFDRQVLQSRILINHVLRLPLPYARHMLASLLLNHNPRRVLMFGLGGGSLAHFFLHYFPDSHLDVIEPNPKIVHIAHRFFSLPRDPRLTIHLTDGASFVSDHHPHPPYDLILVDAFDHQGMARSIYATTFFRRTRALLSPAGVMALNTHRTPHDICQTLHTVVHALFPNHAFRLPVQGSHNIILLCCLDAPPARDPAASQRLAWITHPDLDFVHFMKRMTPLKRRFWHTYTAWLGRIHPSKKSFSL